MVSLARVDGTHHLTSTTEEAEGVTALISEWLELDAADDWVRHDAEIVITFLTCLKSLLKPHRRLFSKNLPMPIGGKIAKVLEQFSFWATEAPDILRYKTILEGVVREVRGS